MVAALAVFPAAAAAEEPSGADKQNAAEQCKAQRADMGPAAFNQLYGTNKGRKNAFGKCVAKFARDEQKERKAAHANAAKQCKAERDADRAAFEQKYGTGKNRKNAHGKCVSQAEKADKDEADAADARQDEQTVRAAKACRAEQKADGDAFGAKYGTKSNAFGKCVSQKSRETDGE
jgi:hypothetical protein